MNSLFQRSDTSSGCCDIALPFLELSFIFNGSRMPWFVVFYPSRFFFFVRRSMVGFLDGDFSSAIFFAFLEADVVFD